MTPKAIPVPTDGDLVRLARSGDEAQRNRAFALLVERYQKPLLRRLSFMLNDEELAADVLQTAFFKVARALDTFDADKSFRSWFYTIALNAGKNALRDRKRKPFVAVEDLMDDAGEDRFTHAEDPRSRLDEMYEDRELGARIVAAVEQLPAIHREVFMLREMRGFSYEAIGRCQGITVGTVKSRLHRARVALASSLEDWRPVRRKAS